MTLEVWTISPQLSRKEKGTREIPHRTKDSGTQTSPMSGGKEETKQMTVAWQILNVCHGPSEFVCVCVFLGSLVWGPKASFARDPILGLCHSVSKSRPGP